MAFRHTSYTLAPLPAVPGISSVANEVEVAAISALAERFRAFEIRIGQIAKVDDVRVAEHRAEFHTRAIPGGVLIGFLLV